LLKLPTPKISSKSEMAWDEMRLERLPGGSSGLLF
jgi:hypothetical protein